MYISWSGIRGSCTHSEVDMQAAYVCIYNMPELSESAKFIISAGWKNPSTPSQFSLPAPPPPPLQWKLKACGLS